ncbi:MAG: amino acid racemase [Deltaproteobacteria bacterium]|jgi:aspartate racemase|nr:amino acid racemase [Deltaproteobacteria bacterium]
MAQQQEKCAGVLGGMGPDATVDFMNRLIRLVDAKEDSDHIRCIVDNNPKVPSRIKALFEGGKEAPAPCLMDMARRLEAWGADFLVMPCNTAHHYHEQIRNAVRIPVLNMIELAAKAVEQTFPHLRKAGILATSATVRVGLYEKAFGALGIETLYPDEAEQAELLDLIKSIKAGQIGQAQRAALIAAGRHVLEKGAQALVLACTELSVIAPRKDELPFVDASQTLAEETWAIVKQGKAL